MADDLSAIVSGEAERLGTGYTFTEGPLWHHDGYLLFVDVRESHLYRWFPGQRPFVVREDTGGGNGLTFDSQGRVIMCQGGERRVVRLDSDFNDTVVADNWDGKRLNPAQRCGVSLRRQHLLHGPWHEVPEGEREIDVSGVMRVALRWVGASGHC